MSSHSYPSVRPNMIKSESLTNYLKILMSCKNYWYFFTSFLDQIPAPITYTSNALKAEPPTPNVPEMLSSVLHEF